MSSRHAALRRQGSDTHVRDGQRQCQQLSNPTQLRGERAGADRGARRMGPARQAAAGEPRRAHRETAPWSGGSGEHRVPAHPGVTYTGRYNGSGDRDFGPRVVGNSGVIDNLIPVVLSTHRPLVPKWTRGKRSRRHSNSPKSGPLPPR